MSSCSLFHRNPTKPTQERSRRTLEAILDAGAALILEQGYDQVSTNAIAARAGIAIGSLYRYFPDKRSLLSALVERESAWLSSLFAGAAEDAAPEDADAALDALVAPLRAEPGRPRLCMRVLRGSSSSRDFGEATKELDAALRAGVEGMLARLAPGAPAETLRTRALVGVRVFETVAAEIEASASEEEARALRDCLRGLLGSWVRSMGAA